MCLAIPGELLEILDDEALTRRGKVSFGGIVKEVNLACVPQARIGDFLTVHVGLALSIVDKEEALRVFDYLREVGELRDLAAGD